MTDDYNLAKPNSERYGAEVEISPYMVDAHLPEPGTLAPGEPSLADRIEAKRQEVDATGFVPGQDRTKSAPELLEENKNLHVEVEHLRAKLARMHQNWPKPVDENTSDGYHTFRELYNHRRALTAALAKTVNELVWREQVVWRSRLHHPEDGPMFDGEFIVGIDLPNGTIRYHYANQYWDDFWEIPELEHAPKWDGAGPELTVTRLLDFARG